MAKYYVESGSQFQVVTHGLNAIDALTRAIRTLKNQPAAQLADLMIVNERGFVWHREDHELYGDELVIPTRLLLGEPTNGASESTGS